MEDCVSNEVYCIDTHTSAQWLFDSMKMRKNADAKTSGYDYTKFVKNRVWLKVKITVKKEYLIEGR